VAEEAALAAGVAGRAAAAPEQRSDVGYNHPVPRPPFWGARVLERIDLKAPLAYLNETMLFQVQWGFRKKRRAAAEWKKYVDSEIRPIYRELIERCQREEILRPQAIYGYWPCNSDGNDLICLCAARRRTWTARSCTARSWCVSRFRGSADTPIGASLISGVRCAMVWWTCGVLTGDGGPPRERSGPGVV